MLIVVKKFNSSVLLSRLSLAVNLLRSALSSFFVRFCFVSIASSFSRSIITGLFSMYFSRFSYISVSSYVKPYLFLCAFALRLRPSSWNGIGSLLQSSLLASSSSDLYPCFSSFLSKDASKLLLVSSLHYSSHLSS